MNCQFDPPVGSSADRY